MKKLLILILLLLSSCAGGGSSGGETGTGASAGSKKTVIGYIFSTPLLENALYSDGSVDGSPTSLTSGTGTGNLLAVAIAGTGNILFQTNASANDVISWKVFKNGTVSQIGTYNDEPGCSPESLAATKTELFVGCQYGGIDSFTINADGSLSVLQAPAYTAGTNYDINSMAIDQSGTYLIVNAAVTTTDSEFLQLAIGGGGTLTLSSSQTGIVGWQRTLIADPNTTHGNYFYAGGGEDTNYYVVSESGGTITATEQSALQENSWPVWIDSSGTWLSMLDSAPNTPTSTSIQQYTISSSGSLSVNGAEISVNSQGTVSSSLAGYDSAYGFVIMMAGDVIIVGAPNSLNGSMTIKGTGIGGYNGLAYVPVN